MAGSNGLSLVLNKSEVLIYLNGQGDIKLQVRFEDENVWLNQQMMAELFQTTKQNIGSRLKNIFSEGELQPESVVKNFFTTAQEGKKYKVSYYNLDAIISVGYRVKSRTTFSFSFRNTQRGNIILCHVNNRERTPMINLANLSLQFHKPRRGEIL